jgi:hypothetical protein
MFNNQVWLALALIGTFLTIFVVGVVVDMMLTSKRRYATVLQTQVGVTPDSFANIRQEQLKTSALERLIFPFAGKVISSITRLTPLDLYGRTNRLIELAGNPPSMTAERIVAFKIIGAIAGLVVGILVAPVLPFKGFVASVLIAVLFAFTGYTVPERGPRLQGLEAPEGDPQGDARHDGPPDDQRRGGARLRRRARPGRQERSRSALGGDRPDAPGDADRREQDRGASTRQRPDRGPGTGWVRAVDDPGRQVRRWGREGAAGSVDRASTEASSASGRGGTEGAAEAPVPHDLHGAACLVHRDPGAGAIKVAETFFGK